MKKSMSLIALMLSFCMSFSQNLDYVNADNGVSYGSMVDVDTEISIPLHIIETDAASIPIYLSYNTKGERVTDVPSSVGYGWQLYAGGEIQKQINHLVDENEEGWLFNDDFQNYQTGHFFGGNVWTGKTLFEEVDATPDIFRVSISNGQHLDYVYGKSGNKTPVILKQTGGFYGNRIDTDFNLLKQFDFEGNEELYQDEDEADISIMNKQGIVYSFRKGLKRTIPYDIRRSVYSPNATDSSEVKNYYLHKVKTVFNNDFIDFEYVDVEVNKFIRHALATRHQSNSDIHNPPSNSDPIYTKGYYEDVSIEDSSRREIKKITTNKETIEFVYQNESLYTPYPNIPSAGSFSYASYMAPQEIKQLDEIKVYDRNGNYVFGYKFEYADLESDDRLNIKRILKYAKNHKDYFVYKKFDYYESNQIPDSPTTYAQDILGYPNGAFSNGQSNENLMLELQNSDRIPNEDYLIRGMLKSVVNSLGGRTSYEYKLNAYNSIYYGGLLVDTVSSYDENDNLINKVVYDYQDAEGFGLPLYDVTQTPQGEVPPNTYEDGYFDHQIMYYSLQTYFSKKDPKMTYQSLPYLTAYNVSSIAYGLRQNTPVSDDLIQGLQLQGYVQQETGSFYRKITQTQINTITNQAENGHVIRYYRPSLSGLTLDKKLERVEYYNASNIKLKEDIYNYESINTGNTVNAFRFDNVHLQKNTVSSLRRYVVENYPIYQIEDVLRSVEAKEYDDTGNLLINRESTFLYMNENNSNQNDPNSQFKDYSSIKRRTDYNNGVEYGKVENKFAKEYQNTQHIPSLVNLNPIIEQNIWVGTNSNWKLRSSTVKELFDDANLINVKTILGNKTTGSFYSESNFLPSHYEESTGNLITVDTDDKIEYRYDENQKIKAEINTKNFVNTVYQRSSEYNGVYVDAILTTTTPYDPEERLFLKKSFENLNENNVIEFGKAFSGSYVFDGEYLALGEFPNGYEVSFWSYEGNKWEFNTYVHNGGALTINKPISANYMDEVIVKPRASTIVSYTYKPLIGVTSILDGRGEGDRREFDIFGRLLFLLDKNGKVIKEYRYNNFKGNN